MVPDLKLGAAAIARKGWWAAHRWLLLRRASQLGILVLFLLGPMAGVWVIKGNLASSLLLDTVPMTDPTLFLQMLAAGLALPATTAVTGTLIVATFYYLVGGRAYCAWVCPVNVVTDGAHWLREKMGIKTASRLGRGTRYWMLGLVLVLSAATGTLAFELVNPVAMLHRGIIFGMGLAWAVVLGVFLFDLLMVRRGWCSHLCPMGAFYGLLGEMSPVRVRADARAKCDDCNECYLICPEPQVIRPALKGAGQGVGPVILSGDCTNCGRCIDICSEAVFRFGWRYPNHEPGKRLAEGPARHA